MTYELHVLTFAYADPPYVGCSQYYDHPDAARWDNPAEHVELMHALDCLDGWALSCSVPSLPALLRDAPTETRIGTWVKPFAAYKRNVRVAYTWEPVLWKRNAPRRENDPVGRDHLSCPITLRRGFTGAKPAPFVTWLRVLLGAVDGDTIIDLFPGSGAVTSELERPRLAL